MPLRGGKCLPISVAGADNATLSVKAEDEWLGVETAEHNRETAVTAQMCGGFIAAAGDVKIGDSAIVEAAKTVHAFGREIDATLPGGGGGEKQALPGNEIAQIVG